MRQYFENNYNKCITKYNRICLCIPTQLLEDLFKYIMFSVICIECRESIVCFVVFFSFCDLK